MGFDLVGINPKNEKGKHFANNVWWWRKLWLLCCSVSPRLDIQQGNFNDGYSVKGNQHKQLTKTLRKIVDDAHKIKKMDIEDFLNSFERYPFDWDNVNSFLEFMENNEGFEIW